MSSSSCVHSVASSLSCVCHFDLSTYLRGCLFGLVFDPDGQIFLLDLCFSPSNSCRMLFAVAVMSQSRSSHIFSSSNSCRMLFAAVVVSQGRSSHIFSSSNSCRMLFTAVVSASLAFLRFLGLSALVEAPLASLSTRYDNPHRWPSVLPSATSRSWQARMNAPRCPSGS
jgi:hypothetical protein